MTLRQLTRRVRLVFRKDRIESELAEEIQLHVDLEARDLVERGWDPAAARREARVRLGGLESTKERVRDARGGRPLDDLLQDLRYAQRSLRKNPGFATVAALVLALGIGANTALFSAVSGLFLRAIPVEAPEELVRLRWAGENDMLRNTLSWGYSGETPAGDQISASFSVPLFEHLAGAHETLVGLAAASPMRGLNVVVDGDAEIADGHLVSGGFFRLLGVEPLAGRVIVPADDRPTASPVAVISEAYRQRRFGLEADVVDRVIRVNGLPVTIVGVLPSEYTGIQRSLDDPPDIHLPLAASAQLITEFDYRDATWWWVQLLGRLAPGATAAQVEGNLQGPFRAGAMAGMAAHRAAQPASDQVPDGPEPSAVPRLLVDAGIRGLYEPPPESTRQVVLLSVVVTLVLLIVCANVANLLLSRATERRREMAVRLSLGATRGRLARQLATESALLAAAGGGLGWLLAVAVRPLLPFEHTAPFDWRVFAFAAGVSLATAVLFSFVPVVMTTAVNPSGALKESARTVARGPTLFGRAFLTLQVAVSLVLVVGAGLFLKTLGNLRDVEVGFNPRGVLLFHVQPGLNGYEGERRTAFYDRLTERIESIAGVRSVGLSYAALLSGGAWTSTVWLPGEAAAAEEGHPAHVLAASPTFFETMEIPVLTGRVFETREAGATPQPVVVNAAGARAFFGSDSALGQRFGFRPDEAQAFEVVGVVRDTLYRDIRAPAPPTVFRSHVQAPPGGLWVAVRSDSPPTSLAPAIREAVRAVDPTLPVTRVSTQAEQIEQRFAAERSLAVAYSLFGGLTLTLAAIGLFGVVSYTVAQRTNEIGIRIALGAARADLLRMVLTESLGLVSVGVGVGLVGIFLTARVVAGYLFGLPPTDAATIAQAVATLLVVTTLAAYLPARRAAAVDPLGALRCE